MEKVFIGLVSNTEEILDTNIRKYIYTGVAAVSLIAENLLSHPFVVLRRQCQASIYLKRLFYKINDQIYVRVTEKHCSNYIKSLDIVVKLRMKNSYI